jgi:hypothetical protein
MTQPPPAVPQPTRPDLPPTTPAAVWSQLAPEQQRQALTLLAQLLLQALHPEASHDQPG